MRMKEKVTKVDERNTYKKNREYTMENWPNNDVRRFYENLPYNYQRLNNYFQVSEEIKQGRKEINNLSWDARIDTKIHLSVNLA